MLSYEDDEITDVGGYDLVHYDDLSYVASAHQERKSTHIRVGKGLIAFIYFVVLCLVLKTGASGMIAYRLLTKDLKWQWLQTSSRLVYKNSKPDFIISTHRPLM